jgi:hypothetical protein
MYKQYKVNNQIILNAILRVEGLLTIPFDPANTDYQAYLKWLEEGNTPLPAENT